MNSPLRAWMVVSLALATAAPALAFDFVVTEYTDDPLAQDPGCTVDHCTLREAVIAANAGVDADRILLSAGVYTINLVAGSALSISNNTEIVGVGAGITILDAAGLGSSALSANTTGIVFVLRKVTVRNSDSDGLVLGSGTHTVEDCEFSDNGTTSLESGLTVILDSTVTVRRSTFAGNSGRGLRVLGGAVAVENSTMSGNGAQELVVFSAVSFDCAHCTIFDPGDVDSGVTVSDATATFSNSVISTDGCGFSSGGAINSTGGNVESTGNTCSFDQGTDLPGTTTGELDLGPLADNGGPTRTHLPGVSSAALGNAPGSNCPATDQRGATRPFGHMPCDSGSVERFVAAPATPIFLDGFLQGDTEAWSATIPPP